MIKTKRMILLLCASCLVAQPAVAADKQQPVVLAKSNDKSGIGIAAVAGGEAISSYELDNRVRFIIATARMSNTPEVIERIRPQVMRSLIDERLQLQEAGRNGIKIADDEVGQAIKGIEQQRGMEPGSIFEMLERDNIPKYTFTDQVRAQIAWSRFMVKKVKPQIRISDEEVRFAGKKLLIPQPPQQEIKELQIAVLQLPVDKPSRAPEIKKLADKLVGEIRNGASFEEVFRQFSSGAATSGGKVDKFWVRPQELAPQIAAQLQTATKGMVTDAIGSNDGFTIVKVYDFRAVEKQQEQPVNDAAVAIKEILLKLKPDATTKEANVMLQIGEEVAKHPGSCEQKGVANIGDIKDFDIEVNIYNNLMSDLPPAVKVIAENLKVGDISTPFASNEGIRLYMLCEKKEGTGKLDRDRVVAMLFQQKMELESQKHLRDLRRDVYTNVR